ncbi:DJ-1/PfpI family protein [Hymenobacter sp.]|uniref:DJ-1/PfpI family protein n=1 Tax=Hymenobacter sp. TaxID=1898978 RepID=UPI00286A6BEC|nr:DJ-1/PfpI family protein [Hymenobacter sp.]
MYQVAILLFNEVEVLDFAGPFEVFAVTEVEGQRPFSVFTVAERGPVYARNGLSVNPTYLLNDHPQADLIVVPGGGGFLADGTPLGTRREMNNEALQKWVRRHAAAGALVLSVCTGARLLAKAGLLEGLTVTTHFTAAADLQRLAPGAQVEATHRWTDNGNILTSAGISAGIDLSLYVVSRLLGPEVAAATAKKMQYEPWPVAQQSDWAASVLAQHEG